MPGPIAPVLVFVLKNVCPGCLSGLLPIYCGPLAQHLPLIVKSPGNAQPKCTAVKRIIGGCPKIAFQQV
jgi:hypothetical protein